MPAPPGRIKASPEDFVVEELPAYAPSGAGEHLFVRFTKRDLTTLDAVRAIARALGCDPRDGGVAGMKDKRAVTTQTISLQPPRGTTAADLATRARGARARRASRSTRPSPHGNKLKTGHLAGNRFTIVVRGIPADRIDEVAASARAHRARGRRRTPSARSASAATATTPTRALAWLRGDERGPRDPRMQRLLWSALQSAVFNAVLDARVEDGTWATPLEGDLLKLRASGGLFLCADVQTDRARAADGRSVADGADHRGADALARGRSCGARAPRRPIEILGAGFDLARTRALGEGTRRALARVGPRLAMGAVRAIRARWSGKRTRRLHAGLLRATEGGLRDDSPREPVLSRLKRRSAERRHIRRRTVSQQTEQ